jgi:hypothetical protein
VRTWIWALSQSTRSPFIQIFGVDWIGIAETPAAADVKVAF